MAKDEDKKAQEAQEAKNQERQAKLSAAQLEKGFGGKLAKETVSQSKSLSELVEEMKQQSKNAKSASEANVDVGNKISKLEGAFGVDSNEQTKQLREKFDNINNVMKREVELQEQGLPFNQALLDESQDQLKTLKEGIESEEERREANKKSEKANQLLAKMSEGIANFGGKVKESGSFLAGIAGLALALINPEAFAAVLNRIIAFVSDLLTFFTKLADKDMAGAAKTIEGHGKTITAIIGAGILLNLAKIIKGIKFIAKGFVVFKAFMVSAFVPGLTAGFTAMTAAMAPVLAAVALPLAIIAGIALIFYGLYKGLDALREKLGFTSVLDVIMLGVAQLQDGFAALGNVFIKLGKKVAELASGFLGVLGFEAPEWVKSMANAEEFDTNNAVKKHSEMLDKRDKKIADGSYTPGENDFKGPKGLDITREQMGYKTPEQMRAMGVEPQEWEKKESKKIDRRSRRQEKVTIEASKQSDDMLNSKGEMRVSFNKKQLDTIKPSQIIDELVVDNSRSDGDMLNEMSAQTDQMKQVVDAIRTEIKSPNVFQGDFNINSNNNTDASTKNVNPVIKQSSTGRGVGQMGRSRGRFAR